MYREKKQVPPYSYPQSVIRVCTDLGLFLLGKLQSRIKRDRVNNSFDTVSTFSVVSPNRRTTFVAFIREQ